MKSNNLHVGQTRSARHGAMWVARRWLPAGLWAVVIFGLSSLHGSAIPTINVRSADKMVHLAVYGVLGACTTWAQMRPNQPKRGALRLVLGAVLVATLYGLSDEIHQWFVPGRSADPFDLAADFVGSLLGSTALTVAWVRRREGRRGSTKIA